MKKSKLDSKVIRAHIYQCATCEKHVDIIYSDHGNYNCFSCEMRIRKSLESLKHHDSLK